MVSFCSKLENNCVKGLIISQHNYIMYYFFTKKNGYKNVILSLCISPIRMLKVTPLEIEPIALNLSFVAIISKFVRAKNIINYCILLHKWTKMLCNVVIDRGEKLINY